MSRDLMDICSTNCPCKKGKITKESYLGDFNDPSEVVEINCDDCNKKYKVKKEHKLTPDGLSSITYYLIPKNYHDYKSVYPNAVSLDKDFISWLIENYTEEDLKKVLSQFKNTTSSAKLTDIAKEICKLHKKAKNTAKINEIIKAVSTALEQYPNYNGNKKQREDEYSSYIKEKYKHQILINFKD